MTPSSWYRQRSRFAPSAEILALLAIEDQFQVSRRDGFILSDLRHVNLDESSPKIKSYHCSFIFLLAIFLPCSHRNGSWICLPASKILFFIPEPADFSVVRWRLLGGHR